MINVIILNNTENTGNQINDNPKTTATPDPKVAPLANPRVKLSANGLFNNAWNIWPASVKPIPANNACTVLGILTRNNIDCVNASWISPIFHNKHSKILVMRIKKQMINTLHYIKYFL